MGLSKEFFPPPQPPQDFSVRGFEAVFPHTGILGCVVCLPPHPVVHPVLFTHKCGTACSTSCRLAHPGPPATALPCMLSVPLPVSAPPNSLDEWFFFNSLVVGLPYSSFFQKFWLFFVFKFVVLVLLVRGGTVCLPMPPSLLEFW